MNKALSEYLKKLCDEGEKAKSEREMELWSSQVASFLKTAMGPDEEENFQSLRDYEDSWAEHALRIGHVQGLIAKGEAEHSEAPTTSKGSTALPATGAPDSKKVFVVHGRDNEAKESTARFLEKLELQPIILHEQASSGRTVIEKFEMYARDIAFAVVLLTPDDIGAAATSPNDLKARARQNVAWS